MLGIPAVPPSGKGLDAVADIARRRAQGWATFEGMFTAPNEMWVSEVRSGSVRQRLEVAIGWRKGELQDFGPSMLSLGAFERTARRRAIELDLERLTAAYLEMAEADSLGAARGACELLHLLGADECKAWSSGSLRKARELRLQQDRELRGEAGEMLQQACAAVLDRTSRQPYVALGQMCQLWVGRECAGSSFADGS